MASRPLWVDEAESSINALTILEHGVPVSHYLGLPLFENTLTEPWEGHPEYEFRDSSYSSKGVAVYHGWLPMYAIAAAEALCGIRPDTRIDPPRVLHGVDEILFRTVVPRIPAILFSLGFLVMTFVLGRNLGGDAAGLAALTMMAFGGRPVELGFQARYYSMTLFMSVVAAWALWHVVRKGTWPRFIILGIAEGLLFHTHQFSAVVFAAASVMAAPWIVRRENWLLKSLAAAGVAGALILPWVILSGFLTAASSVPKANALFESPADWFDYLARRPEPLVFVAIVALGVGLSMLPAQWLGRWRVGEPLRRHAAIYAFLLGWAVIAYGAFHVLVPAASFFADRLAMVVWPPVGLLIGLFVGDVWSAITSRFASPLAVASLIAFLHGSHRLALPVAPPDTSFVSAIAPVITSLKDVAFEPGTRFYATPNSHFVWTYYTGLPVQSVAPVRRSFFESFDKPVIFIEAQFSLFYPDPRWVRAVEEAVGHPVSAQEAARDADRIWISQAIADLKTRGLTPPAAAPLPNYLLPLDAQHLKTSLTRVNEEFARVDTMPIFTGLEMDRLNDVWLGFFYRFVNPESRGGPNLNIFPLLQDARMQFAPPAGVVIYFSDPGSASR